MSILDAVANQPVGSGASGRSTATDLAVAQFGRAIPFRGLLHDVRGTTNGELLTKAAMAWKVHTMPVGVIGKTEVRKADGWQALVRGDTGATLSITSDTFQAHQNSEIMRDMMEMAEIGDAHVCFAGALDGGRKVVAVARLEGEFELPNKEQSGHWNAHAGQQTDGDKTHLFVVISGGHEVGTPFKIRAMAFRRWCANGAFFTVNASSQFTRTHKGSLKNGDGARIRRCYESIREEFKGYSVNAARLQEIAMEREQMHLYVAELLKPGISAEIGAKLAENPLSADKVWTEVADTLRGKQVLFDIIGKHEEEQAAGFKRTRNTLIEAILEQDAPNGNNLWTGYNGITWHVDHKRGRNPESGTDAALFGAGAVLKQNALETALKFV